MERKATQLALAGKRLLKRFRKIMASVATWNVE